MITTTGTQNHPRRLFAGLGLVGSALFVGWSLVHGGALEHGAIAAGALMVASATLRYRTHFAMLGVK
jgi:hypothetical protein